MRLDVPLGCDFLGGGYLKKNQNFDVADLRDDLGILSFLIEQQKIEAFLLPLGLLCSRLTISG